MHLAPKDKLAAKVLFVALQQLALSGEAMRIADLKKKVLDNATFSDWELVKTGSGKARWESVLEWYSNEYVKAGMIVKNGRVGWKITEVGRNVLAEDMESVFLMARKAYNDFEDKNP